MNLRKVVAGLACSCLLSGIAVMAADTQTKDQAGQHSQWKNSDHALATCVAIANQEEVAMAKFAESKSKNQDVKDFAKMLVSDHQNFLKKLEKFAPEASRDGYLTERNENATNETKQTTTTQPKKLGEVNVSVDQTNANAEGSRLDFVALHRELAENCIRQTKDAWSKKDGNKFDECFIGAQIVKHAEMKNKLTVFERHTSGELRDVFMAGRETTEKHMKRAEEIMKKLSDSHSSKQVSDTRN